MADRVASITCVASTDWRTRGYWYFHASANPFCRRLNRRELNSFLSWKIEMLSQVLPPLFDFSSAKGQLISGCVETSRFYLSFRDYARLRTVTHAFSHIRTRNELKFRFRNICTIRTYIRFVQLWTLNILLLKFKRIPKQIIRSKIFRKQKKVQRLRKERYYIFIDSYFLFCVPYNFTLEMFHW